MKRREVTILVNRSYRILVLSLILVIITSVVMWRWTIASRSVDNKNEKETSLPKVYADEPLSLRAGQAPSEFAQVVASGVSGLRIIVDDTCRDSYFTVLLYSMSVDYRDNPSASAYNQAFVCDKGKKFTETIELQPTRLPAGNYYIVKADQGQQDSWYNPR